MQVEAVLLESLQSPLTLAVIDAKREYHEIRPDHDLWLDRQCAGAGDKI